MPQLNIYLPKDLYFKVMEKHEKEGKSVSQIIREALEAYLK